MGCKFPSGYRFLGGVQISWRGKYLGGINFILQISSRHTYFQGTITDLHRTLHHVVVLSKVATAFDVCFYAFPVMQIIEPVEARCSVHG